MPLESSSPPSGFDTLDIQDYLDATSRAAERTRWVTLVMVVASMFVFAGLLNSLHSQWMGERVRTIVADPFGTYTQRHLGQPPAGAHDTPEWKMYEDRVSVFYANLARAYVDTHFVIRVPVVGFTFDVNDLGLIGGSAFIVILLMLRFSLTRELDNVRLAFQRASEMGRLTDFYTLLAMHQVFTVPQSSSIHRTRLLVAVPKALCALPLCLQIAVAVYDLDSSGYVFAFSRQRTELILIIDFAAVAALMPLTWMAVSRLRLLDSLWAEFWLRLHDHGKISISPREEATSMV